MHGAPDLKPSCGIYSSQDERVTYAASRQRNYTI
jgi:hypothetical protein